MRGTQTLPLSRAAETHLDRRPITGLRLADERLRLLHRGRRGSDALVGDVDPALQIVQHRVVEDLPPRPPAQRIRWSSGLPVADLIEARGGINRRALVIGPDGASC